MVTPKFTKAFNSTYNAKLSVERILQKLELASTSDAANIPDGKDFVVASREGNYFGLLSADYLRKYPKGNMCPTLELDVKENQGGEGSVLEYRIDLQKNAISMTSVIMMTLIFMVSVVWLVISAFVSGNVPGVIIGAALALVSGAFVVKKAVSPTFKLFLALNRIVVGD